MRGRNSVVGRYLALHREWMRLKQKAPSWELATVESAVRALGWVLGVDPEVGAQPRYRATEMGIAGKPPLRGVRLTGAWQDVWRNNKNGKRYWLLEVPASSDAGMEYWAVFLSEQQVAELALAFGAALFGSEPKALNQLAEVGQMRDIADMDTIVGLRALVNHTDWSAMQAERQTERQTERQRDDQESQTGQTGGAA